MNARDVLCLIGLALVGCAPQPPVRAVGGDGPGAPPRLIAHGGGEVSGHLVSNSLEALNIRYAAGCRWFELDLCWTSDGELALIHDWNAAAERQMGPGWSPLWPSLADFLEVPRLDGLTSLDVPALGRWMAEHPEATIVTDVKWGNLTALDRLAGLLPDAGRRVVPQIYEPAEYAPACALGYERLILTLYHSEVPDDEVVAFAREHALLAVTMPVRRARAGLSTRLARVGVPVLVHTVNDPGEVAALARRGVTGAYTDLLCGGPP